MNKLSLDHRAVLFEATPAIPMTTQRRTRVPLGRIALLGFVALVLLFSIVPLLVIVPESFSNARFLTFPPPGYSWRWYEAFFTDPKWIDAAKTSLLAATLTALVTTPLGTAASYAIHNCTHPAIRHLRLVLLLPLMVPVIIVAVGVFFIYARVDLLNTITGLVLADVMLGLPYVVTAVTAGLQTFDQTQEMVARSLGMNRFRSFLAVTLPQIKPSVISGAIFAFIQALDETIVALFISGGDNQTLTKQMFTTLRDEIDPTIAAISTLLTAASFTLVLMIVVTRKMASR
jgi:putative spermidine/putrescine transport system permease protein